MKIACAATIICIAALASAQPAPPPPLPGWRQWIENFGHDTFVYEHVAHLGTLEPHPVAFRSPDLHLCGTFVRLYRYPDWVADQMAACVCSKVQPSGFQCLAGGKSLPAQPEELSFCVAKSYMLARMPTFDLHYLPPAVTVQGTSMLDDNIAFALLADAAAPFSKNIPLPLRLYVPKLSVHMLECMCCFLSPTATSSRHIAACQPLASFTCDCLNPKARIQLRYCRFPLSYCFGCVHKSQGRTSYRTLHFMNRGTTGGLCSSASTLTSARMLPRQLVQCKLFYPARFGTGAATRH